MNIEKLRAARDLLIKNSGELLEISDDERWLYTTVDKKNRKRVESIADSFKDQTIYGWSPETGNFKVEL